MRVWIDIDNPPQVQYLGPLARAFRSGGAQVVLTARDYGITTELLAQQGFDAQIVGKAFGAGRFRKVLGVLRRAAGLGRVLGRKSGVDLLVGSSRSSALLARYLRIPSFVLCDYEYVELGLYRRLGCTIVHPDVIPTEAFTGQGFSPDRCLAFGGLKEDLSFADVEIESVDPHVFEPPGVDGTRLVLVRPPAEESHYFDPASRELTAQALRHLASRDEVTTVISPRHPHQIADAEKFDWQNPPIILCRAVPFVPLLRAVDAVVCSGGTMLREAAYLGIPAFSVFAGETGGVDRELETWGRVRHLRVDDDIRDLQALDRPHQPVLRDGKSRARIRADLVAQILERARRG